MSVPLCLIFGLLSLNSFTELAAFWLSTISWPWYVVPFTVTNIRPILTSLVLLERAQILFLGSGLGAWLPSNILERTECKANSPFHAAMGIATSRMFIHLRKFSTKNLDGPVDSYQERDSLAPVEFANRPDLRESFDTDDSSTEGFHDLESIAGSSRHSHSLSVSLSIYTIFVRCLTYF